MPSKRCHHVHRSGHGIKLGSVGSSAWGRLVGWLECGLVELRKNGGLGLKGWGIGLRVWLEIGKASWPEIEDVSWLETRVWCGRPMVGVGRTQPI